jgi:hypothetical protein
MTPGLFVAWIISHFGLIAGGALLATAFFPNLLAHTLALWLVFVFCVGAGITTALMAASREAAGSLLVILGYALILLGLAAGGLALAALLNFWAAGVAGLSLWALFVGSTPVGLMLAYSGGAMSKANVAEKP